MEQSIKCLLGQLQVSVELHIILHSSAVLVLSHAHNKTGALQLQKQGFGHAVSKCSREWKLSLSSQALHWTQPSISG